MTPGACLSFPGHAGDALHTLSREGVRPGDSFVLGCLPHGPRTPSAAPALAPPPTCPPFPGTVVELGRYFVSTWRRAANQRAAWPHPWSDTGLRLAALGRGVAPWGRSWGGRVLPFETGAEHGAVLSESCRGTRRMWRGRAVLALALGLALAKPPPEKRERVHHAPELSDHPHDDRQDFQYDHEAFLGKEQAKTFDQLTPEESRERLGKIVERIDRDQDGLVTHAELKDWIKHTQNRYIYENVDRNWKDYDRDGDGRIAWAEFKNATYGYYAGEEFSDLEDKQSYRKMLARDERRFKAADRDGDGIATREEFTAFLHPEEFDYMKDIVVTETIEDIDKDGDGFVQVEEYIGDMYSPTAGEPEPEWVQSERQQFLDFRDLDRDGRLDRAEIGHWILPQDYDHPHVEATHLIYESDKDKDERLTKQEILDNWNMFVGSQATNYGEDLTRKHDEL